MSLYATAAASVKALTIGRDSYRVRFPSQAAGTPPAPAHDSKSPFQAVTVPWMWLPSQHLPSRSTASLGRYCNTEV